MDAVEDIKGRLSIEDVVSRYIELKRSGRNLKGLSPFTSEKTASFMVSPEKQIWHDFSSGKGGNMFSFVMEMEGLDFKGALELLARQAGVDLSQYRSERSGESGKAKERLYEALELAAKFYQVQLKQNRQALEYVLRKREFTKETVLEFRIGYSPEDGQSLLKFLLGKGFSQREVKGAGLVIQRARGAGDMFRGRIMIPLMDPFGRIVGFTARLLKDEPNAPKYINTPQTTLYDKGRQVFGLHLAKESIRKSGYSVLVEGNLDVIASHQAGVKQTVATAGTALTEMQLKSLGRFAPDVRLAFDTDDAGVAATERAIPIAAKTGVSLSIVEIPSGKDPDDLIKEDPNKWKAALEKPKYAVDWLISKYQSRLDLASASGKREFTDILLKTVGRLEDSVERDHYLKEIAKITDVGIEAIREKMNKVSSPETTAIRRKPKAAPKLPEKSEVEAVKRQNHFLALLLINSELRDFARKTTKDMFSGEDPRRLLELLQDNPELDLKKNKAPKELEDFVQMLELLYDEDYHNLEKTELRPEAARLQVRLIENYVKTKKAELAEKMRAETKLDPTNALLKQAKELDKLLKQSKEEAI